MLAMQMVNMFGALRPKQKERVPYGDDKRSIVPTRKEAMSVYEKLRSVDSAQIGAEDLPTHQQALEILHDLSRGDASAFVALEHDQFEQIDDYIGETLANQQFALLEDQAKQESDEFLKQNVLLFDQLREEGLNYDHLTDEQLELMRLRVRERDLSRRMESNADRVDGHVQYHYEIGPDNRYYKSGGVVMLADAKTTIDKKVIDELREENPGDLSGQFADADLLKMPSRGANGRSVK